MNTEKSMEKSAIKSIYTTHDLSRLLHVNPRSVINWIEQERLQSFRTPGGHRRVRHEDLMVFLRKHKIPMPAALAAGNFNVLIVESEDEVSQSIQDSLALQNGYNISTARDGITALLALGRERPDLMIIDVKIPGVNGLEVCKQIKSDPKSHTAVIAIGGQADGAGDAQTAGADAFMTMPLDRETLLSHVKKLLQIM
jgi:excisionase family DNA binding protein